MFIFLLKLILIILVVLFVLAIIILFVPIRYRIKGNYAEKIPEARADASWLFGLLKVALVYDEKKEPRGEVRLLGIKIYDFFQS